MSAPTPSFKLQPRTGFLVALLGYTLLARLTPYILGRFGLSLDPATTTYPWNFSPLPAVCLFGGAVFAERRWALFVPFAALLLGDVGIWALTGRIDWAFYPEQPVVYLSFAMLVGGGFLLRERQSSLFHNVPPVGRTVGGGFQLSGWRSVCSIAGMGLAGSVAFFVLTNFATWAAGSGGRYPHTLAGLADCYVQALPFFRNFLIGMAVFLPILFSPLALAEARGGFEPDEESLAAVDSFGTR
ncbi:MAG: hypothetical protein KY476_13430 [Planctomycetes bacterium]|nr:hypothetical protein [Planctomycetota bacterium]